MDNWASSKLHPVKRTENQVPLETANDKLKWIKITHYADKIMSPNPH